MDFISKKVKGYMTKLVDAHIMPKWDENTRHEREQRDNKEIRQNVAEALELFKLPYDKWPKWLKRKFERWDTSYFNSETNREYTLNELIDKAKNGTHFEKDFLARNFCKNPIKQTKDEKQQIKEIKKLLEHLSCEVTCLPKKGAKSRYMKNEEVLSRTQKKQNGELDSFDVMITSKDKGEKWSIFLELKRIRGTGTGQTNGLKSVEAMLKAAQKINDENTYIGAVVDAEQACVADCDGKTYFSRWNSEICNDRTFAIDTNNLPSIIENIRKTRDKI